MKNRSVPGSVRALAGLMLMALGAMSLAAQNSVVATNRPNPAETAAPSLSSQVKMSDGMRDVLNLSASHASEDTIVSFIEGSVADYSLITSEIIFLRQKGVSDRVITTMLNHRKEVAEANARVAAQIQADALASSSRASTQDTQPETTSVRPEPAAAPLSTVDVVPSSPALDYYTIIRGTAATTALMALAVLASAVLAVALAVAVTANSRRA